MIRAIKLIGYSVAIYVLSAYMVCQTVLNTRERLFVVVCSLMIGFFWQDEIIHDRFKNRKKKGNR